MYNTFYCNNDETREGEGNSMRIKGTIIAARRDFVKEHFGDEGWMKVVNAMPPEDQATIKGAILSATWYPFELGNRLDKAIVNVLGKG
jgi:hypothetical protein